MTETTISRHLTRNQARRAANQHHALAYRGTTPHYRVVPDRTGWPWQRWRVVRITHDDQTTHHPV